MPHELQRGDRIDEYVIEESLATGGPVHLVRARMASGHAVVLEASGPRAGWAVRATLRRRALLLDLARGPGVVGLCDVIDGNRTVLVVDHVVGGSRRRLESRRTLGPRLARALDDRVADTARRLEAMGVPPGPLTPDRVLLDDAGRPVLRGPTGRLGDDGSEVDVEAEQVLGGLAAHDHP